MSNAFIGIPVQVDDQPAAGKLSERFQKVMEDAAQAGALKPDMVPMVKTLWSAIIEIELLTTKNATEK
jgi:hypothetical protein